MYSQNIYRKNDFVTCVANFAIINENFTKLLK